jgi:hypothetical protein
VDFVYIRHFKTSPEGFAILPTLQQSIHLFYTNEPIEYIIYSYNLRLSRNFLFSIITTFTIITMRVSTGLFVAMAIGSAAAASTEICTARYCTASTSNVKTAQPDQLTVLSQTYSGLLDCVAAPLSVTCTNEACACSELQAQTA